MRDLLTDRLQNFEGIFTAMQDPRTDVVMFLGHSDWWARVPRNLARAPDQVGETLLVLIMCFGKHFYHALHERYPRAHIVTTRDPTEDPEDVAMLGHLFDGIAARKSDAAYPDRELARHAVEFAECQGQAFVAGEEAGGIGLRAPREQRCESVVRVDHADMRRKSQALARAARRAARSAKKRRIVSCGSPDA